MKIPKEIADKVRAYREHQDAARALFDEIFTYLTEEAKVNVCVEDVALKDTTTGKLQPNGEYVDIWNDRMYIPLEDSPQYLCCTYASISDLIGDEYNR